MIHPVKQITSAAEPLSSLAMILGTKPFVGVVFSGADVRTSIRGAVGFADPCDWYGFGGSFD
jgi:hypothetical protein